MSPGAGDGQDHHRRQPGGSSRPGAGGSCAPGRRRPPTTCPWPAPQPRRMLAAPACGRDPRTPASPSTGSPSRDPHSICRSVAAGHAPLSPYEVLKSPRLGELFEEARRQYDYIVVDTPPLTPIQDCRVIGRWVDGFLLVVTAHRTPRRLVEDALTTLDPSKVLGLVFNQADRRSRSGLYPGYYAGYHSTAGRPPRAAGAGLLGACGEEGRRHASAWS